MKENNRICVGETDVLERTAETVLIPVLYEFTCWVLEQARKEKINRLYFLARDGWPVYLTAKMLCRRNVYSGECRYLYVFPDIQICITNTRTDSKNNKKPEEQR